MRRPAGGSGTPRRTRHGAKWLGDLDDALEHRAVTTAEWARLLTTFGQLASAKGWMGADGQRDLEALVRGRRGSGGRG